MCCATTTHRIFGASKRFALRRVTFPSESQPGAMARYGRRQHQQSSVFSELACSLRERFADTKINRSVYSQNTVASRVVPLAHDSDRWRRQLRLEGKGCRIY